MKQSGTAPELLFTGRIIRSDESDNQCSIWANFEKFDADLENKISQLEEKEKSIALAKENAAKAKHAPVDKCIADFNAISTESGGLKELQDWRSLCESVMRGLDKDASCAYFDGFGISSPCYDGGWIDGRDAPKYFVKLKEIKGNLLSAGKLKIESVDDAGQVYRPDRLQSIAASPLLKANGKVYASKAVLDAEEEEGLLRAVVIDQRGQYYAFLRTTKNTTFFNSDGLRVGGGISVLGRYVGNTKYTTLAGEAKSAPILDVMFIEAGKAQ